MGIQGLTKLIADTMGRGVIREHKVADYFGRKIAIDASMIIYSFLIAMRGGMENGLLTNEAGENTTHLQGLWSRTLRLLDQDIKPVFVFDGKPPTLKSGELAKRKARAREAEAEFQKAQESGNQEDMEKFGKRSVRVTREHNEEAQRLLKLMGIPVIQAPCEAEAQCVELCRAGKVFAVGSDDMDSLTIGANILLRHLFMSEARKMPILEIHLKDVLEGFNMTMDEFIDMCILCGCDYTDSIKGIGPKTAKQLITDHKTIEEALKHIKQAPPDYFPFEDARELFKNPDVTPADQIELKWGQPDEDGLIQFLVHEKQFSEDRVRKGIEKLKTAKGGASQSRLESFFGASTIKRKAPLGSDKGNKKAKAKPKAGMKKKK